MRRRLNLGSFLLGAVSVAIVAGVLGLAGVFDGADERSGAATAAPRASAGGTATAQPQPMSVADIYERVSPGVVFVSARTGRGSLDFLGPGGGRASSGSGFVIDRKGLIVTNQHVIDGARDVRVRFGEDGEPIRARIIGEDPSTDIALLRIDADDVEGGLKPLTLSDGKPPRPGDATIAVGAPFGLSGTVTTGVVSALEREITSPNGFPIAGVVQTDAAINPGNSGGPLLDIEGRVIGVNSQIAVSGENGGANSGVGFAVPSATVREVVPLLERDGEIERPYLGVSTGPARGGDDGALIGAVVERGPADRAGLREGDRIVSVGGRRIAEPGDVAEAIADRKPGDRVEVRYARGSAERTATVVLGERPDERRR